jgi:hypothetical protein
VNALLIAGILLLIVWYARRRFAVRPVPRRPTDDALSHALLTRD